MKSSTFSLVEKHQPTKNRHGNEFLNKNQFFFRLSHFLTLLCSNLLRGLIIYVINNRWITLASNVLRLFAQLPEEERDEWLYKGGLISGFFSVRSFFIQVLNDHKHFQISVKCPGSAI